MSVRFHVDPATGASGKCFAEKGGCPYRGDTPDANHYATKAEAEQAGEVVMTKLHGAFVTRQKTKKKEEITPIQRIKDSFIQDIDKAFKDGIIPEHVKVAVFENHEDQLVVSVRNLGEIEDLYDYTPDRVKRDATDARKLRPKYQKIVNKINAIATKNNELIEENEKNDFFAKNAIGQVRIVRSSDNAEDEYLDKMDKLRSVVTDLRNRGVKAQDILANGKYKRVLKETADKYEVFVEEIDKESMELGYILRGKHPDWVSIKEYASENAADSKKLFLDKLNNIEELEEEFFAE